MLKNKGQKLVRDLDHSSQVHTKISGDTNSRQVSQRNEISKLKIELEVCEKELEGARIEINELRYKKKHSEKMLAKCQSMSLVEKKESQSMMDEIKDLLERSEHLLRDTRKQNQILKNKNDTFTIPDSTHKYIQEISENKSFDQGLERKSSVNDQDKDVYESIEMEKFEEALEALLARVKQKGKNRQYKTLSQNRSLIQSMNLSIVAQKLSYGIGAASIKLKKFQAVLNAEFIFWFVWLFCCLVFLLLI
ncbi:hypothetical protein OnM2_036070 [Erysiphe neolycopersici]|uniref:Uncharacterized protein n=1 Tax=Erysiphe neolycopersici TaxID=212602 RepID=A0A420HXE8_9PEZI|nr:hypothetical protein OnM2_036070 [Erysiphe neolycopersici]